MNDAFWVYLRGQAAQGSLVLRPDHPLMLRAPQALFSEPGNLCAIFSPLALELSNPAHLAARLIESRLALPINCRMILVTGDAEAHMTRTFDRDFNLVVEVGDRGLRRFLRDSSDRGRARQIEPKQKETSAERFGIALKAAQLAFREARSLNRRELKASMPPLIRRIEPSATVHSGLFAYAPRNRAEIAGETISLLAAKRRAGLTRQVRNAGDAHLLESWTLDEGVPYPQQATTHIAMAAHGLDLLTPRDGLVVASAFAGVALTPGEDISMADYALGAVRTAEADQKLAGTALMP